MNNPHCDGVNVVLYIHREGYSHKNTFFFPVHIIILLKLRKKKTDGILKAALPVEKHF